MSDTRDYAGLSARLLRDCKSLLPSWLPSGKLRGSEYICSGIQGGGGSSLSVNIKTGKWMDGAIHEHRGADLIALYATIHGMRNSEAYDELSGNNASVALTPLYVEPTPEPITAFPPDEYTPAPVFANPTEPTAVYRYADADSNTLYYIARYDFKNPDGSLQRKQILPWTWNGTAWVNKGWPVGEHGRPLYGLDHLRENPTKPVMVVEGEKSADAARDLGSPYVVVTWPNGAAAWRKADLSPLYGRKLLLWEDADEPGRKEFAALIEHLLPYCQEIKSIDTRDRSAGWDAADAVAEGLTWSDVASWAKPRLRVHGIQALTPTVVQAAASATPSVTVVPDHASISASAAQLAIAHDLAVAGRSGLPLCNAENTLRALENVPYLRDLCWWDEFHQNIFTTIQYTKQGFELNGSPRQWSDHDSVNLLIRFQREFGFQKLALTQVEQAIVSYARANTRNEPKDWMASLTWDQTPRLATFLHAYMGSLQSDYAAAAGSNWWFSMVARIFKPGCKVDNMLILQGEQGRFKSTAFEVIGGPWYAVATASAADPKAFAEIMKGKMLLELAELASFGKTEADSIKRLLTDRSDRYRAAYGHHAQDNPRRCVLVGTTNRHSFLVDETGARRFWPIWVNFCDLEALRRDRDQLFAEAVQRFLAGESWWEMPESTADYQEAARDHDELESMVSEWAILRPEGVTLSQIWLDCLSFPLKEFKRAEQNRIAKILRSIGWECSHAPIKKGGQSVRLWQPTEAPF